jgi:hypothetical protein
MKKQIGLALVIAMTLSACGGGRSGLTDDERQEKVESAREAREERQAKKNDPVRRKVYLGFGPAAMGNLNTTGAGFDFAGGYAWDVEWILFKAQAELAINGAAYVGSATLGANYFFEFKDLYPYLEADFGAGLAKIDGGGALDGATVGGFVIGGGGGLQILRLSSVNFDLGFRVGALLHNNALGIPLIYTLKLGMY